MTPAEANRAVLNLEGAHQQSFVEAVRADAAGSAGPLALSIAPGYASDRRIKWPQIDYVTGRWRDVEGQGKGETLVDLILWQSGLDLHIDRELDEEMEAERERRRAVKIAEARQQAADAVARWIEHLPPADAAMRSNWTHHETARPEPTVHTVAHRSLRRAE